MKVCVIIPAAGSSERFGSRDKLAEDLGGRPMLLRTVELFTKHDAEVASIIVAGPADSFDDFKFRYGDQLAFHGVKIVKGGRRERWETVRNALDAVPDDTTHIAVHDAARPATPADLLNRVFEAGKKFGAVIPAIRIFATVKRLAAESVDAAAGDDPIAAAILGDAGKAKNDARRVVETLDRDGLVEVQTPQLFEADLLRRAYANESETDLAGVTDDASLVERLGEAVHAVWGDVRNIKVTTPADLQLIRAVLGVRPPRERAVHKRF